MLSVRKAKHELSFDEINELISLHATKQMQMAKMKDYYDGKNPTLDNMPKKADGKSDNRISYPFAYLISSTVCGFMNIPPIVRCEDSDIQEYLDNCFKYNDAPKQITSELLDMSIYGVAVEQMYLDKRGNVRFKRISPMDIITVKTSDIIGDMFLVIKHWQTEGVGDDKEEYIELYYEDKIIRYYQNEKGIYNLTEEDNFFGDVPFVVFKNSESLIGDFQRVTDMIDAYSLYQSEILNSTQDITNALLVLSGCMLSDDQLRQVKDLRVLADEGNIDAKMVYNNVEYNDTYSKQLRRDIFSLSSVVDLTSSEEVGNLSGTALRNRMVNLLYLCSVKANYVKEAVLRRVELILNVYALTNNINVDEIISNTTVEVKYNTLDDDESMLSLVNGLQGIVSQETLLNLLGDKIVSVDDELEKLAKEKEANIASFSFMTNSNGHLMSNKEDGEEDTSEEGVDDAEEDTRTIR